MSLYTNKFPVIELGNNDFITDMPIIWELGKKGSGLRYIVPSGFRFDVSVPRAMQWAFNPNDRRFLKASALHDHMLNNEWSRIESAAVFHEALKADGVERAKRFIMFLAVVIWKYN